MREAIHLVCKARFRIRRMARLLWIALLLFALTTTVAPVAPARGSDTVFDEAGVLGDADKQEVQAAFERVREETGHPLYAFLVPDTNVVDESARRELLAKKARQANVPRTRGSSWWPPTTAGAR